MKFRTDATCERKKFERPATVVDTLDDDFRPKLAPGGFGDVKAYGSEVAEC
jgi:hypothetical protein